MIRCLQSGYNGGVAALHSSKEDTKPKIRYCSRCEEGFGVQSVLKGRILGIGESRPTDYDHWLQCHNCGTVYAKHETRIEPEIGPIKDAGPKGKIKVEKKPKQRIGRGNNPRSKNNKWEIKDSELNAELKDGSVLLAYQSNDPSEPTIRKYAFLSVKRLASISSYTSYMRVLTHPMNQSNLYVLCLMIVPYCILF